MSFQKSPKSPSSRDCRIPEVAEHRSTSSAGESLSLAIDPDTKDLIHQQAYKVFLKRNLRPLAPPADLLANLNDALAKIDASKA